MQEMLRLATIIHQNYLSWTAFAQQTLQRLEYPGNIIWSDLHEYRYNKNNVDIHKIWYLQDKIHV